jgi:tRNA A37 threonylcarbamoyltransferase TsaD
MAESDFHKIASDLATLLEQKNLAYGNAFAKTTQILELLYPEGIKVEQYKDIHVIVRMLDKISRIAKDNDPMGESPYQDLAGYCLLALKQMNK